MTLVFLRRAAFGWERPCPRYEFLAHSCSHVFSDFLLKSVQSHNFHAKSRKNSTICPKNGVSDCTVFSKSGLGLYCLVQWLYLKKTLVPTTGRELNGNANWRKHAKKYCFWTKSYRISTISCDLNKIEMSQFSKNSISHRLKGDPYGFSTCFREMSTSFSKTRPLENLGNLGTTGREDGNSFLECERP